MKYHTETERIANEVFDRSRAQFYVNGREWRPTPAEIAQFEQFEQSALSARPAYTVRPDLTDGGLWARLPRESPGRPHTPELLAVLAGVGVLDFLIALGVRDVVRLFLRFFGRF